MSKKTSSRLAGGTVSNERVKDDFYPTPPLATRLLIEHERFEGDIWEPACGDGAISKVLTKAGFHVYSSDLVYRGFPCDIENFFTAKHRSENIITNPPFSLATQFIERAKELTTNKIAMFLKTTALEGDARYKMWLDDDFPFARMYQFVQRVNFGKGTGETQSGGMMAFAWFVWDRTHIGPPTIHWINQKTNKNQLKIFQ